jgi:hypothetical protein
MPKATKAGPANQWEVTPAQEPVQEPAVDEVVPQAEEGEKDAQEPVQSRPAVNAPKADWVEYAVSQGWSREDAEAATKDALIAQLREPKES